MIHYWIDKKSTLGHGENRISFGEKIPEGGDITKERIEKFIKEGRIGELPVEAAAAKGKDPTKKELKAEAKDLYKEMANLDNEDPRLKEIETRISEIEEALK